MLLDLVEHVVDELAQEDPRGDAHLAPELAGHPVGEVGDDLVGDPGRNALGKLGGVEVADPLADLDEPLAVERLQADLRRLPVRRGPDGRVLYAEPHGRVAWFPVLFQSPDENPSLEVGQARHPKKKRISLSTYHRNLLLSALQTERLIGLTKLVADLLEAGQPPGIELSDYARFAAGTLDRLYRGGTRTYRTSSIKARIDGNKSDRASIDRVREWVGMGPLAE